MYSFRYHVITVIAILLALLIGVILGVSINNSGVAESANNTLADSLIQRLDSQQQSNTELTNQNNIGSSLLSDLCDEWSVGRLHGKTVLILYVTDTAKASTDLAVRLREAGATCVTLQVKKAGFLNSADLPALIKEWTGSKKLNEQSLTMTYQSSGAYKLKGIPIKVDAMVDACVTNQIPESSALAIAKAFNAAQPGHAILYGDMANAAKGASLSCTTALDDPVGEYSIVAMLSGAKPGIYGFDQADSNMRYPALPRSAK
ncbi:MAG: copper transporter [Coriobacteriales bacterium]|jgi:hypothetical protein|nr:copper transporter [Coriobacteriales bacterium]